ncbi:ankyrin repeat-containing domain protein [Xylaria arbuscula]|nr:ankyrin repeat-containing domain protein [Xylaria arbuscula]
MADPLSILGGISAGGHLLGAIVKTITAISTLCENFRDAPRQLLRIQDRLILIRDILTDVESQVRELTDGDLLSEELRKSLQFTLVTILADVEKLQKLVPHLARSSSSIRTRLQWTVFRQKLSNKELEQIAQAEVSLMDILQVLISRSVLTILKETRERKHQSKHVQVISRTNERRPGIRRVDSMVLDVHGIWRWMGLVSAFTYVMDSQQAWRSRLVLGIQPPAWAWLQSVLLQIDLAASINGVWGFRITSGHLYVHNRVSIESPFMRACQEGDIPLMEQSLADQPWALRNKVTNTGETPLLLAITSQNLKAVRWLLEQGADPNDGDDDQVLPVFSTLRMQPRWIQHFVQLPPTWDSWFECLRLLAKHGASVHEVARGKTMGMLDITRRYKRLPLPDYTVDYINLLRSENYVDFDACDEGGWSAIAGALRSPSHGLSALKSLVASGVDISRILDDGRSYLALAAELSRDVEVLRYVYDNGCGSHLNRQDKWGWTALHYCVFEECRREYGSEIRKVQFLLENGAKVDIEGGENQRIPIPTLGRDRFTPVEMADHFEERWEWCTSVPTLLQTYSCDKDVFYDAMESQDNV